MASSLSKRNQARNEQALQELIRSVPGNNRCADCDARNPGWASWSLGIFLCMRCAASHRKLGTHISKVKSLSMDAWTNEQVENMKVNGNNKANELWNPNRKTANVPLDVDEVDSAIDRFIRQKYEHKAFISGAVNKATTRSPSTPMSPQYTRPDSPASMDENPPPPPPKPGRKFGFSLRSASSGSFLSRNQHKEDTQKKTLNIAPLKLNKQSRVFGATIGVTESEKGLEMKLLQLREMGFPDTQQNTTVLRGHGGDLERTIESLVKLGQAQGSASQVKSLPTSMLDGQDSPPSSGATFVRSTASQENTALSKTPRTVRSTNPFENQPQSTTVAFDAAMANMAISSPQPQQQEQTLFPHAIGGYLAFAPSIQQAPYQQPMTPPIPQNQQFFNNPYAQQQPMHNPFMASQNTSSSYTPTNPYSNPISPNPYSNPNSPNPYLQQQTQSPIFSPQHSSFSPQSSLFSSQQQPFVQSPHSPAAYYNPYQQPTQQMMPQPTGKLDKASIMSLYNSPQLNAQSPFMEDQASNPMVYPTQGSHPSSSLPPQRSATMPLVGSKNPFTSGM